MSRSYLRFPHLHGETLVFVAENDVWTAPLAGGRAYRLTADGVPAAHPRISPDGTRVAWTSWRAGAPEVFVSDLDGGGVRRLTYWADQAARCVGWTPDGEVLALSAAGQPSPRRGWAYAVPPAGGTPRRLEVGPVSDLALAAAGPTVLVTCTMTRDMAWWKRYRGGAAGRLWWDRDGSGEFERIAAELDGQLAAPMIVGSGPERRIAFLADHEGWGNVYSLGPDGTGLRRHTDHGAPDAAAFYARHASTDSQRVVYESAGELWLLESLAVDTEPRRLDVRLGGPRTAREPYRVDTASELDSTRPDRTGRSSIVLVRGTVHRLTHRDGPARTLLAAPGARARLARPLDADRAVWIDDVEGEDALCVAPLDERADGAEPPRRHGAGELGRVLELAPAPDGSAVALASHDGRLVVLDPGTGALRELARGAAGEISDLCWSPDSAWLAYCDPVETGLNRIMMARLVDGTLVAVTAPRFVDSDPTFTSDGRYLAFLSRRSFDPIYDEHAFDLTFAATMRPFLVPLAARTPSPFGASPDGRPVSAADEGPEDPPAPEPADPAAGEQDAPRADGDPPDGDHKGKDDDPPAVTVDVAGLIDRVVPIPVVASNYRGMQAGKNCLLWYRYPIAGVLGDARAGTEDKPQRPVLERYDLTRRKLEVIVDPVSSFAVSGDGTRLVVRDHNTLRVMRTDRSGSGAPDGSATDGGADEFEVDTRRIVVTVDPAAEWRQMFDEAGRLMRDHFWTADMAGVDWAGELARYGHWWTPRAATTTWSTCSGSCRVSWAPRTPTCTGRAPVTHPADPGCWVPTWSRTSRAPGGGCCGCCPRRPRRPPRAARCPGPGWTCGPVTRSWRSAASPSTRRTARRRCCWRGPTSWSS